MKGLATATGAAVLAASPSLVSLGAVRRALTPAVLSPLLSGQSDQSDQADRAHIALTFDDGPDVVSTPRFLTLLDKMQVQATFFVLGQHLDDLGLVREMAAAGHELAVHGWDHRPVALHGPRGLRDGIRRTRDLVEDATGLRVGWYRPPYGLVTPHGWWAARAAGLETVLWTAWGRDWERRASVGSIIGRVLADVEPGGTVLLHDSDRTSAAGSWIATLAATEVLVETWHARGLAVGTLGEHLGGYPGWHCGHQHGGSRSGQRQ